MKTNLKNRSKRTRSEISSERVLIKAQDYSSVL